MILYPELSSAAAVAVVSATEKTCHFPIGDVGDAGFHYCGAASAFPTHYCMDHVLCMGAGYVRKVKPTMACVGMRQGRAA